MRFVRFSRPNTFSTIVLFCLSFAWTPSAWALFACPKSSIPLPVCSYTAMNGSCKVMIDRLNPVTPPTIYVRRGCFVTVEVDQPSPFETLTLDWKSSAVVVPPDAFQTAFSSVNATIGKVTIVGSIKTTRDPSDGQVGVAPKTRPACELDSVQCDDEYDISEAQKRVQDEMERFQPVSEARAGLSNVQDALQPPPIGTSASTPPWGNPGSWKVWVRDNLGAPIAKGARFKQEISMLEMAVKRFEKAHEHGLLALAASTLRENQSKLDAQYSALDLIVAKLAAIALEAEKLIPDVREDQAVVGAIQDQALDKNYQLQVWNVSYSNKLGAVAKRVSADTMKSPEATLLGGLADAPAKTVLVSVTVQFQNPSRVEVSSGLMIPLLPYHSYVKAAVGANGSVSDNVVQETRTYAVVPMAFINFLLKDGKLGQQRSAVFFTGGVGVNPSTTAVEFGAG